MNKKELAIALSQLLPLKNASAYLEQYPTECEIAAEVLWLAKMQGDIEGKAIADLGCGNGVLGIGALLLNAKKVYFIDIDKQAMQATKENLEQAGIDKKAYVLQNADVAAFKNHVDTVLENPPFGVQKEHADRKFLEVAFKNAKKTYSFHKIESKKFLEAFARENKKNIRLVTTIDLPIKRSMQFHKKKVHEVKVGVWKWE